MTIVFFKGIHMDDSEYSLLVDDMYDNYGHLIKKLITKCLIKQFKLGNIKFNKIYAASFGKNEIEKRYLRNDIMLNNIAKKTLRKPNSLYFDKTKYRALGDMIARAIYSHRKFFTLVPVYNYGYNNTFCFNISEDYLSIHIFFRIIE
jgi:hypothetical protein